VNGSAITGNTMAREREPMPVPDDDGSFLFELWKEGAFLRGYAKFEDARADCDRGNKQKSGSCEVWNKGQRVWPKSR
jgi:hypothetical protein